jgi:putative FmdB family regulatory protein
MLVDPAKLRGEYRGLDSTQAKILSKECNDMPIYEYQCEACGHQHEVLQKISDDPLTTCPKCGNDALKKMISAAGFRLSGNGWYETDFKSGKQKNLSTKDSDGSSGA